MSRNIDDIEWESLKDAFGWDTRGSLKRLTSPDAEASNDALGELTGNIILVDDIYEDMVFEVTPCVIPFLIDFVVQPATHHRAKIVDLLIRLTEAASRRLLEQPITLEFAMYASQTYTAVADGFEIYKALIGDSDAEIRRGIASLIGRLSTHARDASRLLYDTFEREASTEVKVEIVKSVIRLASAIRAYSSDGFYIDGEFFERVLLSSEPESIRIAAAYGLIAPWDAYDVEHNRIDFSENTPAVNCIDLLIQEFLRGTEQRKILSLFSERHLTAPLIRLLHAPEITAEAAHKVGYTLMYLTFVQKDDLYQPHKVERTPGQYTAVKPHIPAGKISAEEKRTVLRAILESDKFWQHPTNLFSLVYGLPDSRDDLRAYAASLP